MPPIPRLFLDYHAATLRIIRMQQNKSYSLNKFKVAVREMPAATPHGPSHLRISLPVENVMDNVYVVKLTVLRNWKNTQYTQFATFQLHVPISTYGSLPASGSLWCQQWWTSSCIVQQRTYVQ